MAGCCFEEDGGMAMARRDGRRAIALACSVGGVLLLPAPAGAVETFGSDLSGGTNVFTTFGSATTASHYSMRPQTTAPGGITSPIDGVIVRWRIKVGMSTTLTALRLTRPGESLTRTGAGTGEAVTPQAFTTSEYPTRLPVKAGDALGLNWGPGSLDVLTDGNTIGHSASWTPPLLNGEPPRTGGLFGGSGGVELLINADVEADADGDGFGDESQDACPTDTNIQDRECLPPETTITARPKDKTKKRTATFEFTSDEPGSNFECSIDGKAFACTSPVIAKVSKGRHVFQVEATDQAGNTDATPATDDWKVKKKRKKK
jgi:hypothetical protein